MRKKTAGLVLAAAGAVLILSALLLLFHNRQEDRQAGERSQAVLEELRRVATDDATLPAGSLAATEGPEATQVPEMPTVQIDGYDYIGTLTIPALELELPVMAQWDYDRLTIAPCRQFGTTQTDDLVIAAHNYIVHFGLLYQLSPGDTVAFRGVDGAEIDYAVAEVSTLAPDEVEAVQNSGYALTLYTCTSGGVARTVVFCDRAGEQKDEK